MQEKGATADATSPAEVKEGRRDTPRIEEAESVRDSSAGRPQLESPQAADEASTTDDTSDAALPDFAKAYLNFAAVADEKNDAKQTSAEPIYLLCQSDRRSVFESLLASWRSESSDADAEDKAAGLGAGLEFIDDLPSLSKACEAQAPLAVFVDSVTSARLGPRQMSPMFVRRDRWPVLRVVPRKGMAIVFSLHPPIRTTFRDALRKLHEQGAQWLVDVSPDDHGEESDQAG